MIGFDGPELTPESVELLEHPLVCGAVLFARNYENRRQLEELVQSIHQLERRRLLTAVDQEGGRVQRFRAGFVELPPLGSIGALYHSDPGKAREAACAHAFVMASELRAVHVDISFAPVADLSINQEVIGDRAFDEDPDVVSVLLEAYMTGMREAGMAATVKHFPGHGSVGGDSHSCTPVDDRALDDILACDLQPFRRAIVEGAAGVMMGHVIYPNADAKPASFSSFWIGKVLREQMSYAGAVFSDDLCMTGAETEGDTVQRARAALQAGCDVALVCEPDAVPPVLDRLELHADPARLGRLAPLHGRRARNWRSVHADQRWRAARKLLQTLS